MGKQPFGGKRYEKPYSIDNYTYTWIGNGATSGEIRLLRIPGRILLNEAAARRPRDRAVIALQSSALTLRRFSSMRSSWNEVCSKLSKQHPWASAFQHLQLDSETTQDHVGKANIICTGNPRLTGQSYLVTVVPLCFRFCLSGKC